MSISFYTSSPPFFIAALQSQNCWWAPKRLGPLSQRLWVSNWGLFESTGRQWSRLANNESSEPWSAPGTLLALCNVGWQRHHPCIWRHMWAIVSSWELSILMLSIFSKSCCSVAKLCPTFWDPVNCSMTGFPVLHRLPEFAQTHVHWVNDAIQPSHPLWSPSTPALNLSQHQGLFQWIGSGGQSIGALWV